VIDLFLGPLEAEEAVQVEVVEGVEMTTQPFTFHPFEEEFIPILENWS
jgi:hypothetical protein